MRKRLALAAVLAGLPAAAQDVIQGQETFRSHCAACHGLDGTGNGPMTAILEITPPDLTTLASIAGGTFPVARVVRTIDGRDMLLSHGGPMPLFGTLLQGESAVVDGEDGTPIITKQAVVDLTAWIASIQR